MLALVSVTAHAEPLVNLDTEISPELEQAATQFLQEARKHISDFLTNVFWVWTVFKLLHAFRMRETYRLHRRVNRFWEEQCSKHSPD